MIKISIIIPVLNEVNTIPKLLEHLTQNISNPKTTELIFVDGGSDDDTLKLLKNTQNIHVFNSEKGRAKQMNLGARKAQGEILYFLHADSLPPKNFDHLILNEVSKGNKAGCFKMKFDSNHFWLKLAGWLTQLPFPACRGGDQSLFVTKTLFNDVGGYDETFFIYEDNDLIRKLYKRKSFVVINKWLITSARTYRSHGVWKLQYYYAVIHLKKFFGASAMHLNEYYKKHVLQS
ncbi:TIGR04283 family arsenosugar biosynthesis glycosyltransferase [Gaetbulibacter aestuarii]|uniref:TIGR04283 family arsenosugar biosynthesis glycosyltransferase n=1 Tax=Gaetbulibacter aestuarii TaxID=1502358 RepID=A0ABW7MX34_9FLAO